MGKHFHCNIWLPCHMWREDRGTFCSAAHFFFHLASCIFWVCTVEYRIHLVGWPPVERCWDFWGAIDEIFEGRIIAFAENHYGSCAF
jgi:hypothetical protein